MNAEARMKRVYPRVCGGTVDASDGLCTLMGLSPRVRGNPPGPPWAGLLPRSIPACAGEPNVRGTGRRPSQVYPRVCGGTLVEHRHVRNDPGLSPRVRGNLLKAARHPVTTGSIPACAGEPSSLYPAPPTCRVYPRVCGGTAVHDGQEGHFPGLSPRVRGNPWEDHLQRRRIGSIPACAGEPPSTLSGTKAARVYPRVCGGTFRPRPSDAIGPGLSPRVRGNLSSLIPPSPAAGSIPACAGEPGFHPRSRHGPRVYPRVCGGTEDLALPPREEGGLSPRVRGNPVSARRSTGARGSIPACAGEP